MSGLGSGEDEIPAYLRPGEIVGERYRITRLLGAGGMGFVVEAEHTTLGQSVAVKVLRKEYANDPDLIERFKREGQIAARLPSDHIARVYDVGQTLQGEPLLVMELLKGCDLEEELRERGPLPIAEAVDLVLNACKGVAAAHAEGLVHRDLKPANLFLQTSGTVRTVKILDFGITKVRTKGAALTQTTMSYGTPQYMSPEQIKSAKHVDERTDQHALGVILYELLTGEPPFQAESVPALMVVIATEEAPPIRSRRPEVPAALEDAVLRALAKRRSARFADLGELATAIAPYGSEEAPRVAREVSALLAAAAPPDGMGGTLRVVARTGGAAVETLAASSRTQRPHRPMATWKVAAGAGGGALATILVMAGLSALDDEGPRSGPGLADGAAPEAAYRSTATAAEPSELPSIELSSSAVEPEPAPSATAAVARPLDVPDAAPVPMVVSKPPPIVRPPAESEPAPTPIDPGDVFGN